MKVLVNALPKSGTNLLQKLMELLDLKYDKLGIASSLILGNYHFIRQLLRGGLFEKNPIIIGFESPIGVSSKWLNSRLKKIKNGYYISGHVNYSDRFFRILQKNEIKTIHIIRDPRSVLISYANYFSNKKGYYLYNLLKNASLDEKVEIALKGGEFESENLNLESFNECLKKIDGWFHKKNVLIVRFEDLIGEMGGGSKKSQIETLHRILNFLEIKDNYTEEQIKSIALNLYGGTHTYRTGKIDSWKTELSENMIEKIEIELNDFLVKWNYL